MKKTIVDVDKKNGIWQATTTDERVYIFTSLDKTTGLPSYTFKPSSTYILSVGYPKGYFFQEWLKKMGDEAEQVKILAGEKGSKIHKGIEMLLCGERVPMDAKFINPTNGVEEEVKPEEYNALLTFKRFWEELTAKNKVELIGSEFLVDSDKYDYAGTADILLKVDKEYWLIDIKSGQNVYEDYKLQLSSYKQAILEKKQFIGNYKGTLRTFVLQVGYRRNKNGYKLTETEDKFEVFLNAKGIFHNEVNSLPYTQIQYPMFIELEKN